MEKEAGRTSRFDTKPADVEKQAFILRKRMPSKEIQPAIKLKSITAIERLEDFYDNNRSTIDIDYYPSKSPFLGVSFKNLTSDRSLSGKKLSLPKIGPKRNVFKGRNNSIAV